MINNIKERLEKTRWSRAAALILALLMVFAAITADISGAYADDGAATESMQPSETPQQPESPQTTESPQPSETPGATESPQPSETPGATESPQPSETPGATESPQPSQTPNETPEPTSSVLPEPDEPTEKEVTQVNGLDCIEGEVLVKFKDSATDYGIIKALTAAESELQEELSIDNLVVTDVPEEETIESFIETIEDRPDVEYAQPNYVYSIERTVNDPYAVPYRQWHLDRIGVYDAWDVTMGSPDIRVAVLDTGVDIDHPEFAGQIYTDYDFVNNDGNADDDEGHGTFTAGLIAAKADNGIGGTGIAPNVRLIIAKVLDQEGTGTSATVLDGLYYAVQQGADVINMSFGYLGRDSDTYAEEEAINYANSKGVICVAAAGNEETPYASYPSDFEACISVIATDIYDRKAWFSNYGYKKDISAPGTDIFSTYEDDGYATGDGTSASAPIVAATAALIRSVAPGLTVDQVKNILYTTAVDLGTSGKDDYYGYGLVCASAAVNKAKLGIPASVSAAASGYNSVKVSWGAVPGASGYRVYRATSYSGKYSLIATTSSTSYTNKSLNTGTAYYYKVCTYAGSPKVNGGFSAIVSATPRLSRVTGPKAAMYYPTSIKISWKSVSGRSGYEVERSASPSGGFKVIKSTSSTYYKNTGLTTNTTYYYRVRAYRKVGRSKVYGDYSDIVSDTPRLAQVTGLKASVKSATKTKVSWRSVTGKSGYEIWRSTSPTEGFVSVKRTTKTYYYDANLTPNVTYYYKVQAYRTISDVRRYGPESAVKSVTPLFGTASNAKASMYSVTSVKITWKGVSGRKGYEIWRSKSPDGEFAYISSTTKTYYYDKKLAPNETYYYQIKAYVMVGKARYSSGASNTAGAMPKFGPMSPVTAAAYSSSKNKIAWKSVTGKSGYEIWRSELPDSDFEYLASTSKTYYYDGKLAASITYYYKVKAYVLVGKTKYYTDYSNASGVAR